MLQSKLKQTEIGMIPEDWEELKLSEAIEINPKRELKKGVSAKKVPMDCLSTFNKKIQSFEVSKFSGGSKFINGDTIMARITPCLENGKTAFVDILRADEVGFGSTEFIVLSGKKEKTTNDFVYYLSISPQLRKEAIKSMTGTSGRQRVQNDLFEDIEIIIPPINEQSAIAKILSDLDSKIELNQQMNKTLEAIGQAIFKHWFVDFEFPNEKGKPYKSSGGEMIDSELGEIPKGWKVGKLGEIMENFDSKRVPLSSRERDPIKGEFPYYGAASIMDYINKYIFDGVYLLMGEDGTVIDDDEHPVLQYAWGKFWVNNHAHVLRGKGDFTTEYLFVLLNNMNIKHIVTGAVQPKINQGNLNSIKIIIPDRITLKLFSELISHLFNKYKIDCDEINSLIKTRDSLLPRLMSGKIRVPVEVRV